MIRERARVAAIAAREKAAVAKEKAKITGTHAIKWSGKGEHLGFVLIAVIDVFHAHQWLFVVSVWLLMTGVPALWLDITEVRKEKKEKE